jgi:hypothetical protein
VGYLTRVKATIKRRDFCRENDIEGVAISQARLSTEKVDGS